MQTHNPQTRRQSAAPFCHGPARVRVPLRQVPSGAAMVPRLRSGYPRHARCKARGPAGALHPAPAIAGHVLGAALGAAPRGAILLAPRGAAFLPCRLPVPIA